MRRDETEKLREQAAKNEGVEENLYTYAAGPRVSDHLESTQLNKFGTKGGTGFAAEDANALNDKLGGAKVDKVGTNNAKNGADRIADGIPIQTKYFDSAAKTVNDAFDKATGTYRYEGMQLEVPRDQYESAVKLMREKIAQGKVPGVTNPDEATNIVKEGSVTYKQARNIARVGNIDSLMYDVKNNAVTSAYALGIGFGISFARAKWEGKPTKEALEGAAMDGLLSFGTSFVAGVITSQLLRTQMARQGTVFARSGVKAVARTEWGRLIVDKIASASTGKALSGAAATNHVSKLVRSNVITSVVTTVVLTGPDVYRAAISKNTSWAQVSKNLLVNGAGVAAGSAGWMVGAATGAALGSALPGLGTVAGGIIGGLAGSIGAGAGGSYVTKRALDYLIEDDSAEMMKVIEKVLPDLGDEYLMTQAEFDQLLEQVGKDCTLDFFREMYSQDERELFARVSFESNCEAIVNKREPVVLPVAEQVQEMLDEIVASIEWEGVDEAIAAAESYRPNFVLV